MLDLNKGREPEPALDNPALDYVADDTPPQEQYLFARLIPSSAVPVSNSADGQFVEDEYRE